MRVAGMAAALLVMLFAGCASAPTAEQSLLQAGALGMRRAELVHHGFALTSLIRAPRPDLPLRVYLEGDGRAWLDRRTPSTDPTPVQATGLRLALADAYPNVAYLARPCQFSRARSPACEPAIWTGRRFAPEVIAAMNAGITDLVARTGASELELVGYSGGAAIAVALASQRADIRWIATVAGNLDSEEVNRSHRVTPMPASVNPVTLAARIAALPQLHFVGADDEIIPLRVARAFIDAGGMQRAKVVLVGGATHRDGWVARWPALLHEAWEKFPADDAPNTFTIGAPVPTGG